MEFTGSFYPLCSHVRNSTLALNKSIIHSTFEDYIHVEELAEQMNIRKALLTTIDNDTANKNEAIADIRKQIAELESRLQKARGGSKAL